MREPGSADQAVCRVFVVERWKDPAFVQGIAVALAGAVQAAFEHFSGETALVADGCEGQFSQMRGVAHNLNQVAFHYADMALGGCSFKLDQAHAGSGLLL